METYSWHKFSKIDTLTTEGIVNSIKPCIEYDMDDPILLAKYGKLCYLLGEFNESKLKLNAAISYLPNLQQPWYYLSLLALRDDNEIEHNNYMLKALTLGLNIDENHLKSDLRENFHFENLEWFSNYCTKFELWYNTPWNKNLFINYFNAK